MGGFQMDDFPFPQLGYLEFLLGVYSPFTTAADWWNRSCSTWLEMHSESTLKQCHLWDTIGITYRTFFLHTTQSASSIRPSSCCHGCSTGDCRYKSLVRPHSLGHFRCITWLFQRGTVTSSPKKCHYSNAMEIQNGYLVCCHSFCYSEDGCELSDVKAILIFWHQFG